MSTKRSTSHYWSRLGKGSSCSVCKAVIIIHNNFAIHANNCVSVLYRTGRKFRGVFNFAFLAAEHEN